MTPMWAKPRAAPPPSASPMRGLRGGATVTASGAMAAGPVAGDDAGIAEGSAGVALATLGSGVLAQPANPKTPRPPPAPPTRAAAPAARPWLHCRARPAPFRYAASEYAPDEYVVR